MTEKLKPCAYCQSPMEFEWMKYEPYAEGGRWFVVCSNLDCPTNQNNDEDKEALVKRFNERHEPRCPCGGVILADTEGWPVPVCNSCYEEISRYFLKEQHNNEPRCDRCKHWDQYQDYNIDTHTIEGVMDLGGCYQHVPVKTTEVGIATRPDFYCKHFEEKE